MLNTMRTAQDIFIENLKAIRTLKKLSQIKLSELADLSPGIVGDIETGRRNPTLTTIEKISLALDVPVHQLFYDTHENLPEKAYSTKKEMKLLLHDLIDRAIED